VEELNEAKAYEALVLRDVRGESSETEAEVLCESLEAAIEWKDTLTRFCQEVEAELTQIRLDVDQAREQSFKIGPSGKPRYMRYKTEREARKADLVAFKTACIAKLKEAKEAVRSFREEKSGQEKPGIFARLDRLEEILLRIESQIGRRV